MSRITLDNFRVTAMRVLAAATIWSCCGAEMIPSNVRIAVSDRALTFSSDGREISTATLCPGYVFDQLGVGEPQFSPDLHWVLVDVLGPFAPGNVARNHALISVATGGIVLAPEFDRYAGVPPTLEVLSWASGQRATLRYANGKTAEVRDPPLRPFPPTTCTLPRS